MQIIQVIRTHHIYGSHINGYIHTNILTYIHTYIHHTYIHTHIYTHIHTYMTGLGVRRGISFNCACSTNMCPCEKLNTKMHSIQTPNHNLYQFTYF